MKAFNFLASDRISKPRTNGITMILDKGLGLNHVSDLVEVSGEYIDFMKFGWCTSALHDRDLIKTKTEIYSSHGITPYPGGTLFEVAYLKNKLDEYFNEADKLGFKAIEISDGSVDIALKDRGEAINKAKELGFVVFTEVGKKDPSADHKINISNRIDLINLDLDNGADKVLMEAREGGKNIGIYDEQGKVKEDEVEVLAQLDGEKIIWEAPLKNQQVYLILKFGPNVNLGNISPDEATALETMRRGLRGDTIGKVNL